jgi:hypothetical protein
MVTKLSLVNQTKRLDTIIENSAKMTFGGEIKKKEITLYPCIFNAYEYGKFVRICSLH